MKNILKVICLFLVIASLCSCTSLKSPEYETVDTTTSTTENQSSTEKPLTTDTIIVNFGDSIFGNFQDTQGSNKSISSMIADFTGATVYNCGFGGCKMAYYSGNTQQLFTMPKLADAIATDDYSLQEEAMSNWTDATFMHKQSFETLKNIDFSKVDIITISYGTNDYSVSIPIDNSSNQKDIYSFGGALRYSIEKIQKAYPHIKIFICSPTYRYWVNNGIYTDSNAVTNSNGNLLTDYVEISKKIATDYNLIYIDNYYDSGINEDNRTEYFSGNDTTHPNINGRKRIAENISRVLIENM